ncbi:hypothetical protein BWI17_20705 [Betaproteobacteria bacterium GR16-43]|nr:hypothetical protein BWI17_20705 [Betaproteobacteria bacterium GR16-43]
MKRFLPLVLAAALAAFALPAAAYTLVPAGKTLVPFATESELRDWLASQRRKVEPERAKALGMMADAVTTQSAVAPAASPAPAAVAKGKDESVTNTQTAGVDEGGIVKVHGEHLVILRRGRLFTVGLQGALQPASFADAFGEGIDPRGTWYDEMLLHGDTVVVIGYSYQRGGTEVGLFDIDRAGRLAYRATYHLRSNDYYSSRNYASRLVGDKLVFYTPLYLNLNGDPLAGFPAMRKWSKDAPADFKRIAPATRIYRTDDPVEGNGLTLHTVTSCDLAKRDMTCEATGVLGPAGRVFYVSEKSVFVWTTDHRRAARDERSPSSIFRMPLTGDAPSALKASGSPIDQFSFLESPDGYLNVLVRSEGRGEAMWASETSAGSTALLRLQLSRFGDGTQAAPASAYRRLPTPDGHTVQNRFVGNWLLYGSGATWGAPNAAQRHALHAVRWDFHFASQTLLLPHGVDRIEALGRNAVVVGTAGKDLHFTSVRLDEVAQAVHRLTRPDAAQGETRSHGFFYKPDTQETGLVGLPVVGGGRPGHKQLREGSAAVMFLRNDALMLGEVGDLTAKAETPNDNCRASCVDWYGNARPLFLRGRIFALLGYEIVEGRLAGNTIGEVGRVTFAPSVQKVAAVKN